MDPLTLLGQSNGPQPGSPVIFTAANTLSKDYATLSHAIDWSSRLIFQPLPASVSKVQSGYRSADTRKTCPTNSQL